MVTTKPTNKQPRAVCHTIEFIVAKNILITRLTIKREMFPIVQAWGENNTVNGLWSSWLNLKRGCLFLN